MVSFNHGDCVRVLRGPDGTYPADPNLVGMRGVCEGIPELLADTIDGQPTSASESRYYWVVLSDARDLMIEADFLRPC